MTMPSPELAEIMQTSLKEFYQLEPDEFLYCYGVSLKHSRINVRSCDSIFLETVQVQNGKSVVLFVVIFAAIPYSISYVIIVTLMIIVFLANGRVVVIALSRSEDCSPHKASH